MAKRKSQRILHSSVEDMVAMISADNFISMAVSLVGLDWCINRLLTIEERSDRGEDTSTLLRALIEGLEVKE